VDTPKARIFVVGCASLDTIHIEESGQKSTFHTLGGAGLYTALAARAAGASVTLYGPRTAALPGEFKRLPEVIDWIGPQVEADEMPALEIVHHGGGRATLVNARWGAEQQLVPAALPDSLEAYAVAHIAALSSAQRQSAFVLACRSRRIQMVSAGTYARLVYGDRQGVTNLLTQCDYFFMNANEACGMFGSVKHTPFLSAKTIVVTDGERGAHVFQNGRSTHIEAVAAQEVDPTGAGDTFCGATLASLFSGSSLAVATARAAELASRCITMPGAAAMLEAISPSNF
jgi:ribokinase